jgi:large subunit ribosomal protein L13
MQNYVYYPDGLRQTPYEIVMQKHPERLIERAVAGMLPKSRMGRQMVRKLRVYAGAEHPHAQQKVEKLEV